MNQEHEVVLYQIEGTNICVNVMFKEETFWMTQKAMANLFDCTTDNISLHLKNIYKEEELEEEATTELFSIVQNEGQRNVTRKVKCYNLDAIIAVGYRVNSKKATRFRQWATITLKEYITKLLLIAEVFLFIFNFLKFFCPYRSPIRKFLRTKPHVRNSVCIFQRDFRSAFTSCP